MKSFCSLFLVLALQTIFAPTGFGQTAPSATSEAFRSALAEKLHAAEKKNAGAVAGADGWLFMASEFRVLTVGKFWGEDAAKVCRSPKPENADPIPAIVDFQQQLKARGIELLLVPVPPKASIYPEKILLKYDKLDGFLQRFYNELRAKGVDVLDLTELFLETRNENGVFCKTDTHWSGIGCSLAAKAIAEEIRSKTTTSPTVNPYKADVKEISIEGDLGSLLEKDALKPEPEKMQVRCVSDKATGAAVTPDANSPVLLLGDSHTLVFHDFLAEKAGLLDQLTLELGFAPDLIGIRGSGATQVRKDLYRRAAKDKDWLAKKKIVVWCFTAREFTEADQGWQKLPVAK